MSFPNVRLRRLRIKPNIRRLVRQVSLDADDMILPIFIDENIHDEVPIQSMPGQYRYSVEKVCDVISNAIDIGVRSFIIFGIPSHKDEVGSSSYDATGVVQRSVALLEKQFADDISIVTDVCMCEYTNHGHCGIITDEELNNDITLEALKKIAVSHAQAGSDMVGPSGMIDGQVKSIREALDDAGFSNTPIMAYSAKHASGFYGPFRDAASSATAFGDRRSHQMDFSTPTQAMREIELDINEGADIVMVKPALAYLDIIHSAKQRFSVPVAAYNVSGEYAMIKAAAERGWLDWKLATLEVLMAIKRAGADIILTYSALEVARWIKEGMD